MQTNQQELQAAQAELHRQQAEHEAAQTAAAARIAGEGRVSVLRGTGHKVAQLHMYCLEPNSMSFCHTGLSLLNESPCSRCRGSQEPAGRAG